MFLVFAAFETQENFQRENYVRVYLSMCSVPSNFHTATQIIFQQVRVHAYNMKQIQITQQTHKCEITLGTHNSASRCSQGLNVNTLQLKHTNLKSARQRTYTLSRLCINKYDALCASMTGQLLERTVWRSQWCERHDQSHSYHGIAQITIIYLGQNKPPLLYIYINQAQARDHQHLNIGTMAQWQQIVQHRNTLILDQI